MSRLRLNLAIILLTLIVGNAMAQSETHRLTAPVTDYSVHDIQSSNGYALLRGYFYKAGDYSGSVVSVDADEGGENLSWPVISGDVHAIIPDGNGGYYAGGAIRAVDNEDVGNLIHILPNKTLDRSFLPNPFGAVYALVLRDGILYAGGTFVNIGGQSRYYAAAFNTASGTLTPWNPHLNNHVTAIEVTNDAVVLAGKFTQVNNGSAVRNKIASVSKTDGSVSGWNPALEGGAGWTINALASSATHLYMGGSFTKVNGTDRNGLAAVSLSNATLDPLFDPAPLSTAIPAVYSLLIDGSVLYVAGSFDSGLAGDNTVKHLGAVRTSDGTLISSFKPVFDTADQVSDIALANGTLYVYGSFNSVNGMTRVMLAALATSNGTPTAWNPMIEGGAQRIAVNANEVLIAGDIAGVNWKPYNGLAVIEESTRKFWPHPLQVPDGEDVLAMAVSGTTMYIGGSFSSINGVARKNLAAIDLSTGAVLPWNPGASGTTTTAFDDTRVNAIVLKDNSVYVAGIFLNVAGQPRKGLAAIDASSGAATSWNPGVGDAVGMDEYVLSMDVHENLLYVSGNFTTLAGASREYLGALDLTTGALANWHPKMTDEVRKVRVSGNTAYILGDFSGGVNGVARDYGIAGVDINTGSATSFNPQFNGSIAADFALTETDLFVGGYFSEADNEPRPGLAAFSLETGQLDSWNPDLGSAGEGNYDVAAVATSSSVLYVGGGFVYIGNENRHGYTEYDLVECLATATITLDGSTLVASSGESYQWFENDQPVAGATSQNFDINIFEYGRYAVEVTSNGCSARSVDYVYLVTGNEGDQPIAIKYYPNPVGDVLFIEVPRESLMTVTDPAGRRIITSRLSLSANRITTQDWTRGVYIITVQNSLRTESFKIIKTN